jgi:Flp pilus assembly secretin CpaC
MKLLLLRYLTIACFCLSLFTVLNAQTLEESEAEEDVKHIRVQVEFIDVSHELFTELMFGAKPAANDGELRKQMAQLIKDGKASVMETLLCTAISGHKATTESIEEFIYPTEYEPATLPDKKEVKEGEGAEKPADTRVDTAIGPQPTSFEPRNVGSTLEIEPTLSFDNKIIDLRFCPEIVYHVGNEVWAEWKGKHGNSPIQMPKFYVLRLSTSVMLTDGHYMLAAALTPKNKEGAVDATRKLMVFVKADVITNIP